LKLFLKRCVNTGMCISLWMHWCDCVCCTISVGKGSGERKREVARNYSYEFKNFI